MRRARRFLLQQTVSALALPVVLLMLATLTLPFPGVAGAISTGIAGIIVLALVFVSGPAWGYCIPRDRDYAVARWTWIVPVTVFLASFAWDATITGFRRALTSYLNFIGPVEGDEGLGLLITTPAVSSVLYSIGAAFGYAKLRRGPQREGTEVPNEGEINTLGRWLH